MVNFNLFNQQPQGQQDPNDPALMQAFNDTSKVDPEIQKLKAQGISIHEGQGQAPTQFANNPQPASRPISVENAGKGITIEGF